MIYLIHFDKPHFHAKHYLGSAEDLDARLASMGPRSIERGNGEQPPHNAREGERKSQTDALKNRKDAPHICPICSGDKAMRRGNNYKLKGIEQ